MVPLIVHLVVMTKSLFCFTLSTLFFLFFDKTTANKISFGQEIGSNWYDAHATFYGDMGGGETMRMLIIQFTSFYFYFFYHTKDVWKKKLLILNPISLSLFCLYAMTKVFLFLFSVYLFN